MGDLVKVGERITDEVRFSKRGASLGLEFALSIARFEHHTASS